MCYLLLVVERADLMIVGYSNTKPILKKWWLLLFVLAVIVEYLICFLRENKFVLSIDYYDNINSVYRIIFKSYFIAHIFYLYDFILFIAVYNKI